MKTIFYTGLLFLVFSTALVGVVGGLAGFPSSGLPVEVLQEPRTSFSDEAMRAILEADDFREADVPQLIILGASGAQEAYRPADVQGFLPGWQVNNLAIGAANIGELREVFEHCLKALPGELRRESVVVLGLSYPLFVPDEVRWRHPDFVSPAIVASGLYLSDLKRESMRNPLFLDSGNPVFRALPPAIHSLGKQRAAFWNDFARKHTGHPADLVMKWKGWRWRLPNRHAGDRSLFPQRQPQAPKTAPTPREQMAWLENYMGTEPGVFVPEQFVELDRLIHRIRATGIRAVVVDMPLPSWHSSGSPYAAPYRKNLAETLTLHQSDAGVVYLDLSNSSGDGEFRDSIHPLQEYRAEWSARLAQAVVAALDRDRS